MPGQGLDGGVVPEDDRVEPPAQPALQVSDQPQRPRRIEPERGEGLAEVDLLRLDPGLARQARQEPARDVRLGAPLLARLLRDATLTSLLVIAAAIPGLYAFNAAYVGFLNGMGALARQGIVYMVLALARFVLIGAAVLLGYGVQGTLYGAVLAALLANIAARWLSRIPSGDALIEIEADAIVT